MTKKQLSILIAGMIFFLALFSCAVTLLTQPALGQGMKIDSYVSSQVYRTDGSVESFDSNYFGSTVKGDKIKVTIPLPLEQKISPAVIFFSVYQCAVELSYDGNVLYKYGEEEAPEGTAIGNVLVCATIPDEAWGNSLTLECLVRDYGDFSKLNDVTVCEARNSIRYLLGNKIPSYLLSFAILIVFSAIFFVLLFWKRGGIIRKQGIFLSAFCVGLMLWQMGYERMFYVLSDNVVFCGTVEYAGIFFAPAPFCMFLYYVEENKYFRKAMKLLASLFAILFAVATILNFTSDEWHYCRLLRIDHILIGITALCIFADFILVRCKGDNKRLLIRFGIILYIIFTICDLLTFYVDTTGTFSINKGLLSVTSLGMYVFLLLMLISYIMHVLEHVISIRDKERLEKMAYQDGLTKAPNRRSCLDYIETLRGKSEYTVFFFDVNNLKMANDEYGHEVGDKLIFAVAELIGSVFKDDGFYGRYGGDEFIAVVEYADDDRIKALEKRLEEEMKRINDEQSFPFKAEFSYGIAISSEGEDADEIVRMADKRMYERKWLMKNSHSETY